VTCGAHPTYTGPRLRPSGIPTVELRVAGPSCHHLSLVAGPCPRGRIRVARLDPRTQRARAPLRGEATGGRKGSGSTLTRAVSATSDGCHRARIPGVPTQSVSYTCGAPWGSGYVHGPTNTAFPLGAPPRGLSAENPVRPAQATSRYSWTRPPSPSSVPMPAAVSPWSVRVSPGAGEGRPVALGRRPEAALVVLTEGRRGPDTGSLCHELDADIRGLEECLGHGEPFVE
jgi:hypothetical protein